MNQPALHPDALSQFSAWYNEAVSGGVKMPDAMALATVSADGRPSVRIVLYKGLLEGGVVFYTNYESRKGHELAQNPYGSLAFHWPELERQVRIEGKAARISHEESSKYFQVRPRESQLGAWASHQSEVLARPEELEERVEQLRKQYEGKEIPCPPHWGGYRLEPETFEFWQGRSARLHERYVYVKSGKSWEQKRLSP